MTVAELIETLKAFPQDLPVQYIDYENGETDVQCVETDFDRYGGTVLKRLQSGKATSVLLS